MFKVLFLFSIPILVGKIMSYIVFRACIFKLSFELKGPTFLAMLEELSACSCYMLCVSSTPSSSNYYRSMYVILFVLSVILFISYYFIN